MAQPKDVLDLGDDNLLPVKQLKLLLSEAADFMDKYLDRLPTISAEGNALLERLRDAYVRTVVPVTKEGEEIARLTEQNRLFALAARTDDALGAVRARLIAEMVEISHKYTMVDWMEDLEFILWDAISEGDKTGWLESIDKSEVDHLRALSEAAGGWATRTPAGKPVFVDQAVWVLMLDKHRRVNRVAA